MWRSAVPVAVDLDRIDDKVDLVDTSEGSSRLTELGLNSTKRGNEIILLLFLLRFASCSHDSPLVPPVPNSPIHLSIPRVLPPSSFDSSSSVSFSPSSAVSFLSLLLLLLLPPL